MGNDLGRYRSRRSRRCPARRSPDDAAISCRGAACRANADVDRNHHRGGVAADRRAGSNPRRRALPHRSRSDRGIAALSHADRAGARGGRGRRAGGSGRARRQGRRPRGAVLEPALRTLLLLRPRRADPVRGISRAGAEGRGVRRRQSRPACRWPRRAAIDVSGIVRRILHRVRPAGDCRAEGNSVRPRLPDRLRRHDRRRRRAQSRRHRAWRYRDGDRLRRGGSCRGAGRAAGRRRRDHRGRHRSGETRARREDGRNALAWTHRRTMRWPPASAKPMAAASMS